jgi:RNA polymerase sigma-70 factor (ECF subfamily)
MKRDSSSGCLETGLGIRSNRVYLTGGRFLSSPSILRAEECVDQDEHGFDDLLKENKDRIFNLLFRLTGNYHTAEDLFQETFLRAFRGLDRYEGRSRPFTWLYAIALNVYKDHVRKRASSRHESALDPTDCPDTEGVFDPEAALLRKEENAVLQKQLSALKPGLRVPVVLFYIEGMSVGGIAEITGRSEASIKTALHRARKQLRAAIGREALGSER